MAEKHIVRVGSLVFEWTNPIGSDSSKWVVVRQSGRRTRTIIGELTSEGEFVEHKAAPFGSVIVAELRKEVTARTRALLRAIVHTVGIAFAVTVVTAFMFGITQVKVVASESMKGTFNRGDLLVIVSTAIEKPEIGDIVAFNYYNLDRTELIGLFSHRIVGGAQNAGWQTKGDANADPEASPVLNSDIVGTVVGWVPAVGFLLQPQALFGVFSVLVIAYLLGPELRDYIKERRNDNV